MSKKTIIIIAASVVAVLAIVGIIFAVTNKPDEPEVAPEATIVEASEIIEESSIDETVAETTPAADRHVAETTIDETVAETTPAADRHVAETTINETEAPAETAAETEAPATDATEAPVETTAAPAPAGEFGDNRDLMNEDYRAVYDTLVNNGYTYGVWIAVDDQGRIMLNNGDGTADIFSADGTEYYGQVAWPF